MIKEREEVCKLMCLPTVVGCCKREIKCELMSERGLRLAPGGGGGGGRLAGVVETGP